MSLFKKRNAPPTKPFICHIDKTSYHEFASFDDAENWGMSRYSAWANTYKNVFSLTYARYTRYDSRHPLALIEEPIELYCGYRYREINDYLRTHTVPASFPKIPIYAATMSNAILSAPTTDLNLIAYRQVSDAAVQDILEAHENETLYCEKGFMSVALHKETCIENCGNEPNVLKIYMPKNIPAVYVNSIVRRDEAELLIAPEMVLRLIATPYLDPSEKMIYEVELLDMIAHK